MTDEQRQWCATARQYGGSFVSAFAKAMLCADEENEQLLMPALTVFMEKYPRYLKREEQFQK